ncbi:cbb3-type cytochrome c oxidase subunit I [Candidatus Peregrinibacteria bacterium]|nr:cbb3-type cytochrome c oxidase subunit I [Candidatus Peregrinibacteria bacterium]
MANDDRQLVEVELVKAHLIASVVFFITLIIAGLLFSLQFLYRYPFPNTELLSPGRIRMIHTNLAAYGFIVNAFIAGLLWAIPRMTKLPMLSAKLGWFIFWTWQAIVMATILGILTGYAQAIEWGETPIFVDPFVVIGAVLLVINLITPIIKCKDESLYVSLWYFSAGFIWLCLTYLMGNYFPQFFVPGAAGAAISGLFIHDLVGLFVTPMGWGLMYYFVPIILKKPIWSHGLSLIGFWALAFCYPLNGVHHYLWSPIPMYAQYGAVVSTVAVEIVVTTVLINFFATLWGSSDALRTSIPLRWFYTGMICYFITCLQCSIQVLLTVQEIIHFTDWVVGHAHLVMFGVFGFWIMGFLTYLWPKVVGKPWHSELLNGWHYWLTTIGMGLMFFDLVAGGLLQGFLWKNLSPWEDSITYSIPFWAVRAAAGIMIFIGQVIFVYNLWATTKKPIENKV